MLVAVTRQTPLLKRKISFVFLSVFFIDIAIHNPVHNVETIYDLV